MENQEYLSEDKYQKNKKRLMLISLVIAIVGVAIGLGLIVTGAIKQHNAKIANEKSYAEAQERAKVEGADIQKKIDKAKDELAKLEEQQKNENSDSFNGNFDDLFKNDSKNMELFNKISELKMQIQEYQYNLENLENTIVYDVILPGAYKPYYKNGLIVIGLSLVISLTLLGIAKRREINAFATQQKMPIEQEKIEKMAPTIGKAGATVVKEITPVVDETVEKTAPAVDENVKEVAEDIKEGTNEEVSSEKILCSQCGASLDKGSKFCHNCGSKQ